MALTLTSPAFAARGPIPKLYTCEGRDISPPLAWSGVPHNAKSLALIVDDPDAPDPKAPKRVFVHWVLYNIPATVTALAEDEAKSGVPQGSRPALNDWKRPGYGGPCPPVGRHRYFHKLYALDVVLADLGTPTKVQLLEAMKAHVIDQAELIGTYEKSG